MSELPGAPNGRRRPKSSFTTERYLGTCPICKTGCYVGDETTRGRGQWLGLCHKACWDGVSK